MNTLELPAGYGLIKQIDLQKDKKLALLVNGASLVVALLMIAIGWLALPRESLRISSLATLWLRLGCLLVGILLYMCLHELVHGIGIWYYSKQRPRFGFTGLYAFAGNDRAYFDKRSYLVIALSPIVVWGVVLLILNLLVPPSWVWVVYLIQVINISGAAGDVYVTGVLCRLPADILVNDKGVSMSVYGRVQEESEC